MRYLLLISILSAFTLSYSQCTVTLQPGSQDGKDAYIQHVNCSTLPSLCDSTNIGNSFSFLAGAWTQNGYAKQNRAFLEFDLSEFNDINCNVAKAILILNHDGSNEDHCGQNSNWHPCKKNEFELRRVTSYWDEHFITWNNQPSFTSNTISLTDNIFVGDSSSIPFSAYNINVTDMINFWIDNPDSNFGFMVKLKPEFDHYRRVRFSSSDNPNQHIRPKLILQLACDSSHCNNIISGNIFDDINKNCSNDINDVRLENWIIKIEPGPIYSSSDQFGNYSANVDVGNYTVTAINKNNYLWSDSCISNYNINFTSKDTSVSNIDFPFIANNYCSELWVDIGVNRLRKCHNEWFKIMYCNKGNIDEDSVYIDIELDKFIIPQGSSIPYTLNPDSTLRFKIGKLEAYDCGSFTLNTLIDCDADFGITQCANASIYPHNICEEINLAWDKSSISVSGFCDGDSMVCFNILNTGINGGGDMQSSSIWRLYEDNVLIQTGIFQLEGNENIELCFNANGHTLRLEADQHVLHPGNSHPKESIEACGNNYNIPVTPLITVSDDDTDAYTETICNIIVASFDPNEKIERPVGITENKYISHNDELEYTVHFQNTGNAPAMLVTVKDTLSEFLDPTTLVSGVSSHNYTYKVKDNGIVEWRFDNINLIDSITDEPNSHGYVKFKIKQQKNNDKGTLIENRVGIYFDFNTPVITDFAWNIVWDTTLTSIPELISQNNISITVYPNPANNVLNFKFLNREKYSISIINVVGQQIKTVLNIESKVNINLSELINGIYLYQITNSNGDMVTGKFVKE